MLISQVNAHDTIWYKIADIKFSDHSLHLKIPTQLLIIMVMKTFEVYAKLHDSKRRFNRACDQILLLNTRLRGLRKRYNSARSSDSKTFRFPLRMRMLVAEGLVKSYYHYANMKRYEILELRSELSKIDNDETEEAFSDDEM